MEKTQCKRCMHFWIPRVEDIKECPKCKSRVWDKFLPFNKILKKMSKSIEEKKNEESKQN